MEPVASAEKPPLKQKQSLFENPRVRKVSMISLVAAVIGLIYWFFFIHPYVSTDDARVAATPVRVAPDAVGGRLIKLNVKEGDRVKKGDVLAELDHPLVDAQLQRAKTRSVLTQRELKRVSELVAERGLAQKELDTAKANADIAEANLATAQVASENAFIRSPVNGIVVQEATEQDDIIEPGQTVVTVTDIDATWIAANVEETSVGGVKVGQPVSIDIDEGGELKGKVLEVRDATAAQFSLIPADNPSGNFTKIVQRIPLKVALDPHPNRELRSGQSVEIKIKVK